MTVDVKDFTYYPVVGFSCVLFLITYKFGSPWLSKTWVKNYKLLPRGKQIEWNTRVNSSLHSVIVSALGLYALLLEDQISRDPIWGESQVSKIACATVVGYMVADLIVILVHYKEFGEVFYVFHHCTSIYAYYYVITYGTLPWFAMYRLLAELSTPFVNQRWFLDVLGYAKSSPEFIVNGLTMAVVFCLVRIVTIPPYYFKIYSIYGTPGCDSLGHVWYVLIFSCIILDAINIFWFYKIFQGARKVLRHTWESNKLAKAA